MKADLALPHGVVLFGMAANRLDDPGSKRAWTERSLADTAWPAETTHLTETLKTNLTEKL